MAKPGPKDGGGICPEPLFAEAQGRYRVTLTRCNDPMLAAKVLRDDFGALFYAKQLFGDRLPQTIASSLTRTQAERMARALEACGAYCRIEKEP